MVGCFCAAMSCRHRLLALPEECSQVRHRLDRFARFDARDDGVEVAPDVVDSLACDREPFAGLVVMIAPPLHVADVVDIDGAARPGASTTITRRSR